EPLTVSRVIGAVAVLFGSALITFQLGRRRSDQLRPAVTPPAPTIPKELPIVFAGILALALVAGMSGPTQAAINARLRTGLDAPMLAALTSFSVGMIPLLILVLSFQQHRPNFAQVRMEPWWLWI